METHIMDCRQLMLNRIMVKVKPVGEDGQNGQLGPVGPKLATRWHPTQICPNWPPDGAQVKFAQTGHQMAPNSNLPKLATRWRPTQICPNWPPDGTQVKFAHTGHSDHQNFGLSLILAQGTC